MDYPVLPDGRTQSESPGTGLGLVRALKSCPWQEEDGTETQPQTEGGTGNEDEAEEPKPVRLATSVPDIGWQFGDDIVARGLGYASNHFAFQEAKEYTLRLALRGTWCPDESTAPIGTESISLFGETLL